MTLAVDSYTKLNLQCGMCSDILCLAQNIGAVQLTRVTNKLYLLEP